MADSLLGHLKRGLLFIVSAPAGTGKTTLVQLLSQEFSSVVASISCTTRQPRGGEVDGVHYHFLTEPEFMRRMEAGEFLEHVQLYGSYYGTSRHRVEELLNQGKHVVLVIDTQGLMQLKGKAEFISIFIAPPSFDILEQRLAKRQTESKQIMSERLVWAKEEMARQHLYDYLIVNDDLSVAYQILRSILIAEEHRLR